MTGNQSQEINELAKAMSAVTGGINVVATGKFNAGKAGRYKYLSVEDIFGALSKLMSENGLTMSMVDIGTDLGTWKAGKGEMMTAFVRATYRIMHVSGQWVDVVGVGYSRGFDDKILFKAMTGAQKYAARNAFSIADNTNDVDANRSDVDDGGSDKSAPTKRKPAAKRKPAPEAKPEPEQKPTAKRKPAPKRKPAAKRKPAEKKTSDLDLPEDWAEWAYETFPMKFKNVYEARNSLKNLKKQNQDNPAAKTQEGRWELWVEKVTSKEDKYPDNIPDETEEMPF